MAGPKFPAVIRREVRHFKSGATYVLQRADSVPSTDENVAAIVAICNERAVYDVLFRERWAGRRYGPDDARRFLEWAAAGWRDGAHFVFLVTTMDGRPAAAVDIKGADLSAGEVGYWCSSVHHGLMSNTLAALCDVAAAAGYSGLFAYTVAHNARSQAVLARNGFVRDAASESSRPGRFLFRRALGSLGRREVPS